MKIGYPCINWSVGCTSNTTLRLANYTDQGCIQLAANNLACLSKILKYNVDNDLLFFRIGSDLIPFASHDVCKVEWDSILKEAFSNLGDYIKENNIRISMHPDQFVLINAEKKEIVDASIKELDYHARVLDAMGLDKTAKIQIHVGGVYGDKEIAIKRFIASYKKLPENIKSRLVIENDDKSYSLKDCLQISATTKIPVLFDFFHHECLNNGETIVEAFDLASKTWKKKDGIIMTDYSSQKENERKGAHATSINEEAFKKFLERNKRQKVRFNARDKRQREECIKSCKDCKRCQKDVISTREGN